MRLLALAAIAVGAALPLAEQEPGMLMAPHMLERAACELYTESCEASRQSPLNGPCAMTRAWPRCVLTCPI